MGTKRPTGHQKAKICVIAVCGRSTVDRVYGGKGNENSRIRVINAAQQIGAPLPPVSPEAMSPH